MWPVIALVGRPNVGKSTLFNQLTRSRDAIVADTAGLTRDRQYGEGRHENKPFIVVDTGGLGEETTVVDKNMVAQTLVAVDEADIVLFLVDGRAGLTPVDEKIAKTLRQRRKNIILVVNKTDGIDENVATSDFFQLGFDLLLPIAASHGRGVQSLLSQVLQPYDVADNNEQKKDNGVSIAIIGRPNVGKSTLVNRILGETRVVAFDSPGTTRDSITVPFEKEGKPYLLIDTAGLRRRGRVHEAVEKFSVIKALQAIRQSHVCIALMDARDGVTDQDLQLVRFAIDAGKALVIAVNKWDGLTEEKKEQIKKEIQRRLFFADFADIFFISALHGSNVGLLFPAIEKAYASATCELSTSKLSNILQAALANHPPPLVSGRRIKLRYAHAGGHNPPHIVIHGNQTEKVPEAYKRYLVNTFRKALTISGTPIRITFKTSNNPFKDKKNQLSDHQKKKRQRLVKFHKKKKN